MKKYTLKEHLIELKQRLFKVIIFFFIAFFCCYLAREFIYNILLSPLIELSISTNKRVIYTGLTEAFFSYIKLSFYGAFFITIPMISFQIYKFISPGLKGFEKKITFFTILASPLLFYIGSFFVYYFVMPRAWDFFLSYEIKQEILPLVLEPRISEYLNLVMQLTLSFGMAFQLPIFIIILSIIGIIKPNFLRKQRRFAVVIIFTVAAIFTPPDVFSQIALAIPLLLLYELSIILCELIEKNKVKNVRH